MGMVWSNAIDDIKREQEIFTLRHGTTDVSSAEAAACRQGLSMQTPSQT
jgi:hypothetical protein